MSIEALVIIGFGWGWMAGTVMTLVIVWMSEKVDAREKSMLKSEAGGKGRPGGRCL